MMSPITLKSLIDAGADIELIDIRENYERAMADIGGRHLPMDALFETLGSLPKDKKVVLYCNSGRRGEAALHGLRCRGFENVENLDGGICAWRELIDPSLPTD